MNENRIEPAEIHATDDGIRANPQIRVTMLEIIEGVSWEIELRAGALLKQPADPFLMDQLRDLLLWQLVEFLTQRAIDRDGDEYAQMVKASQLDRDHAGHHFRLDQDIHGRIIVSALVLHDVMDA